MPDISTSDHLPPRLNGPGAALTQPCPAARVIIGAVGGGDAAVLQDIAKRPNALIVS